MQALLKNLTSEYFWIRLFFMLVYLILVEVAVSVLTLFILLQFIYRLFVGQSQADLFRVSSSLSKFVLAAYRFLTYQSETKPFPFSDWPAADAMPEEEDE